MSDEEFLAGSEKEFPMKEHPKPKDDNEKVVEPNNEKFKPIEIVKEQHDLPDEKVLEETKNVS